jgi:ectoine hydroxylase-related dioxygenase (phytanoyl-CoA dioxygenase family)
MRKLEQKGSQVAAEIAPTRRLARIRSLYRSVSRVVKRFPGRSASPAAGTEPVAAQLDGRPAAPIVHVATLGNKPVEPGLAAVWGWAYSGEAEFPEGVVEIALDDEDAWVELSNRVSSDGSETSGKWNDRCGFNATLNTFLLANGTHRIRLRVKTRSGDVAAVSETAFRVNNLGRLAEITTQFLKSSPASRRIWVDVIDSSDFPFAEAAEVAWFERADALDRVGELVERHKLDPQYADHLRHFVREGYVVLESFIEREHCDRINQDLDGLIASGVLQYERKGERVQKLFEHSESTRALWAHAEIIKVLSAIFDDQAIPCQTLNFLHGSQQDVHQDLVHLTPFPQGFMCGVWVALEDTDPDSGPLVVYPRSHRLPRLYTRTVGAEKVRDGRRWREFGAMYIPRVRELIDHAGLEPMYYTPKAGSALIWHENLAHGGSPRKNDELTRKSMVSHYFARGAAAWYDSQGTPAWTTPPDDD